MQVKLVAQYGVVQASAAFYFSSKGDTKLIFLREF